MNNFADHKQESNTASFGKFEATKPILHVLIK